MTFPASPGDAPHLPLNTWMQVLRDEYLESFIQEGGASVKLAITDEPALRADAWQRIEACARDSGYLVPTVRSEVTKVHLAQEIFFRIASQVPWAGLAETVVTDVLGTETGFRPEPGDGSVAVRLSRQYALDETAIKQSVTRGLSREVLRDVDLARDFRYAMLPLCRDASGAFGTNNAIDSDSIVAWLTGQGMRISAVTAFQLHSRVNRANALVLFDSLLHWVRKAGKPGLVVLLDLDRLIERPPRRDLRGEALYYTRVALLDAFEVLRRLIDNTDRMEGCLVVAFASSAILDPDPSGRGLAAYLALQYRLADEVRGRDVANPLASLVRLAP